jgi:orotidine-5'-phosphate decarboxylase
MHDIPNTVAGAMQAIHVLQPAIVTIHASGGRAMMEDAKAAAGEHTKVVAVTVLTSLDDDDLSAIGSPTAPAIRRCALPNWHTARASTASCVRAMKWAISAVSGRMAISSSPACAPPMAFWAIKARRDAARARDAGASVLVIGRPITRAEDPVAAARAIEATL